MQTTYSYIKFFEKIWEKEDRVYTFHAENREEALIWQERFRGALWDLLGISVLQKYASDRQDTCGLPRLLESVKEEGYLRYKYEMETLPDVWMPYYVLVPEQTNGEAILALHAHGADKNTVCHVAETEAETEEKWYAGDTEIALTDLSSAYSDLSGMSAEKILDTAAKSTGDAAISVTVKWEDDTETTVSFTVYDSNFHLAEIDGEARKLVNKRDVEKLVEDMTALLKK